MGPEFGETVPNLAAARATSQYREITKDLLGTQRASLIRLREDGQIDNTVLRRVQRLLDLQTIEMDLLGDTGHAEIQEP